MNEWLDTDGKSEEAGRNEDSFYDELQNAFILINDLFGNTVIPGPNETEHPDFVIWRDTMLPTTPWVTKPY